MKETQKENLSTTVSELLTAIGQRQLAYVSPKAKVQEIISAFARVEHARLVYVVDNDKHLSGVISLGNLSRHLFFHHCNKAIDNLHLISMATSETAADFVDRPTIAAHLSESIEPVLERMLSAGIKEIPVLDETEHLVGDLTLVDILQHCSMDIWK
ncbi:MAG: CBS domain-containing protein [Thermodesulfobacteriota bacterium]|nr:CBS domain-containing protein [Thermodesulfobacteriota bacterium]